MENKTPKSSGDELDAAAAAAAAASGHRKMPAAAAAAAGRFQSSAHVIDPDNCSRKSQKSTDSEVGQTESSGSSCINQNKFGVGGSVNSGNPRTTANNKSLSDGVNSGNTLISAGGGGSEAKQQQLSCSSSGIGMGSSNSSVASTAAATADAAARSAGNNAAASAAGASKKSSQKKVTNSLSKEKIKLRSNSQSPQRQAAAAAAEAAGKAAAGSDSTSAAAASKVMTSSAASSSVISTCSSSSRSSTAAANKVSGVSEGGSGSNADGGGGGRAIFEVGPPSSSSSSLHHNQLQQSSTPHYPRNPVPSASLGLKKGNHDGGGGFYISQSEGSNGEYSRLNPPYINSGQPIRRRGSGGWEESGAGTSAGAMAIPAPAATGAAVGRGRGGRHMIHHSASDTSFNHHSVVDYSGGGASFGHSASFVGLSSSVGSNGGQSAGAGGGGTTASGKRKKSPWYNALYPTYKSRSEDFKKIFTKLPEGERLIVEYSCALQKDILVHGRLYVSKNYLCFYSNIFRWETCVRLRWKDVKNIVKEKTALVIPNAIEISTRKGNDEKYFFTSFLARDRAYIMLFKLWQNALLGQPASSAAIWSWIHSEYGDELGLTSEDEYDYTGPFPQSSMHSRTAASTTAATANRRSTTSSNRNNSNNNNQSEDSSASKENRISSITGESQADCTEDNEFAENDSAARVRHMPRLAPSAVDDAAADSDFFSISPDRSQPTSMVSHHQMGGGKRDATGQDAPSRDVSYDANGNAPIYNSQQQPQHQQQQQQQLTVAGAAASDLSDVSSDIESATDQLPSSHIRRRHGHKAGKSATSAAAVASGEAGAAKDGDGGGGGDFLSSLEMASAIDAWRSGVEGRELISQVFPISVDQLFTQLFTNSKFFLDFHATRKSFDFVDSSWQLKEDSGEKVRELSFTLSLTHPMGPKHSQLTEIQTMRHSSKSGQMYLIDVDAFNGGIPYADSFYVTQNFCLTRLPPSDPEFVAGAKECCRLNLIANIKYKKTVWGLVKTFIEKNAWAGLEDFNTNFSRALLEECEEALASKKAKLKKSSKSGGGSGTGAAGAKRRHHGGGARAANGHENDEARPGDKAAYLDSRSNRKGLQGDASFVGGGSLAAGGGGGVSARSKTGGISTSVGGGGQRGYLSPSLNDVLVKFILILLAGLFLANSVLFYKLWGLEERLLVPSPLQPTNAQQKQQQQVHSRHKTGSSSSFDPVEFLQYEFKKHPIDGGDSVGGVGGPNQNTVDLVRLLHRQEMVHQLELEKWHEMIGGATELLRQTEQSLQDLQKSIRPLALQKMRDLMLVQSEEWERILAASRPPSPQPQGIHAQQQQQQHLPKQQPHSASKQYQPPPPPPRASVSASAEPFSGEPVRPTAAEFKAHPSATTAKAVPVTAGGNSADNPHIEL